MTPTLKKIFLLILLVGSTLQYGDLLVTRYFVPLLSVFICWSGLIFTNLKFDSIDRKYFSVHSLFFLLFSMFSLLGNGDYSESVFDIVKLFLAFSISFLSYIYIKVNDNRSIQSTIFIMLLSANIFLCLELYGRILASSSGLSSLTSNFHSLKVNSPFMVDSNAVGLYALFYFIVAMYILKESTFKTGFIYSFFTIMTLAFIFTTLSRASIFSALVVIFLFYWKSFPKILKYSIILFSILSAVYVLNFFITTVASDGSGATKIKVLTNVIEILPSLEIKGILIGYGINMGNYIYSYEVGKYSHLLITMIMGHFGIIGAFFYALFFIYFSLETKKYTLIFISVTFIVGLSYLHPFLESIFLVNGILIGLFHNKQKPFIC